MPMPKDEARERIAEIAARAEKFHDDRYKIHLPEFEWGMFDWMAAFAESERMVERMECAKAVCVRCKRTDHWDSAFDNGGKWMHRLTGLEKFGSCDAAAIWSLPKGEL